jgi:hypothetical protein
MTYQCIDYYAHFYLEYLFFITRRNDSVWTFHLVFH